jgi:hypothetical protein
MAHAGGRPLIYKTVVKLEEAIDEYFSYCDNKTKEVHSEKLGDMVLPDPEPYTMSGLAYALGLSRQGLMEYKARDEFSDAIKKARAKIEADVERRMNSKDTFTPGLIFNAKNNFGWKDKTEVEHSGGINHNMSDEELDGIIDRANARKTSKDTKAS